MRITFEKGTPESIRGDIMAQLEGRQLGDMVSIDINGLDLKVTIAQLGTSTLEFSGSQKGEGLEYRLAREKIALTHRPMKATIIEKFSKVVERAGGQVHA